MTEFGSVLAAVISFAVAGISGVFIVPFLKKLKFGQSIKEIGPVWHKAKQGTPTMGGFMFILGFLAAVVLSFFFASSVLHVNVQLSSAQKIKLSAGILMALIFGFIGFMDDYIKVVKKRNLGLTARQKSFLQILAGIVFLLAVYLAGDRGTTMLVPFTSWSVNFGIFYWPIALFIIVGTVNSVNLTDGVDGLAGSVTFIVAIAFMVCSKIFEYTAFATVSAALAGGCLGFLVWNLHPAKVFMGDTGALFLGGLLCAIAFGIDEPLLLIPIGIIYIVETLSVILQIISFKTTGKRIFKMSPIHHHFELSGWSENRIVLTFSVITALFSIAAIVWSANYMGLL